MSKRQLLRDVNLSEIAFPRATSEAILTFLNMTDGASAGSLVCRGLLAFVYQSLPDETLPQYVGEVTLDIIGLQEAQNLLERMGSRPGSVAHPHGALHKVSMEGGVTIDIVCSEVQLLP